MATAPRPVYEVNFTDPDVNRWPWPYLEEVRAMGRAVFNPPSESWLVSSFDDTRAILANRADFAPATELVIEIFGDPTILGSDDPRHAELRSIWGPHLLRGAVNKQTELVDEICALHLRPILDRLIEGETVDVVEDLRMIPTELIAAMIGVPREDCGLFTKWGHQMVAQFDLYNSPDADNAEALREAALAATAAMHEYSGEQLAIRRRAGVADDLLGVLATTDVPMTDHEKRSYITVFIEGAQDTTTKFVTTTLATLAGHPDQRKALLENRDLMPQVLDEVMRWHGVVTFDIRIARGRDVHVGDTLIPEGDHVSPVLVSANRDATRWSDPEIFDIFRPAKAHLGFGFGVQNCMGINLARLVAATIVNKVLDEVPDYQLATDTIDYGSSFLIRGLLRLPLAL